MMERKKKAKKQRHIWHSSYDWGLLIGLKVLVLLWIFDYLSASGTIMLSSVASSVIILTHRYRHHLTTLGTIISAYFVAGILSVALVFGMRYYNLNFIYQGIILFIVIASVLYLLNIMHIPSIAFGMAFAIFFVENSIVEYFFVMFVAIMTFMITRLIIYIWHDHLKMSDFFKEFAKEEKDLFEQEKLKIRHLLKKSKK